MIIEPSEVVAKLVAAAAQAADFTAGAGVDRALAFMVGHLAATMPGTPVVAAEAEPATFRGYEAAANALFLARLERGAASTPQPAGLSLMIGFAAEGRATAGVVLSTGIDGQRRIYGGAVGAGAFVIGADGARSPLHVSNVQDMAAARCAVARSHRSKNVDAKLAALGCKELAPFGGDGLKGVRVASGELELYADPSPDAAELWDLCAAEAIVRAAGGVCTDSKGVTFYYRSAIAQGQGRLAGNPQLHAEALRRFADFDLRTGGATVT